MRRYNSTHMVGYSDKYDGEWEEGYLGGDLVAKSCNKPVKLPKVGNCFFDGSSLDITYLYQEKDFSPWSSL